MAGRGVRHNARHFVEGSTGEQFGELIVRALGGGEKTGNQHIGLVVEPSERQTTHRDRGVVGPHRSSVIAQRPVAAHAIRQGAKTESAGELRTHEARGDNRLFFGGEDSRSQHMPHIGGDRIHQRAVSVEGNPEVRPVVAGRPQRVGMRDRIPDWGEQPVEQQRRETVVQAALGGTSATTVLEGDRQFGVVVRLDPKFRQSIDEVREIKVAYQTPSGSNAYIPLSELADISLDTGASFIYRERSQRYIPIKFSVRGRDLGSTVAEAQRRVAEAVQLPAGYRMIWSGEFDNLEAAKARLLIVVPVTLLLLFVLLYSLFNSLRDSLLALAGIPFAVGGGLIALYLAGLDFSISAAIGFISLFGVAVMDGILNITYFRELRASGMSIAEAVFNGAEQRMRPMLMTALSAGVGLFPAALSHGIGSQVQRPLATVVVGGMFIGPLLLLIVAPALRKIFLSRERVASPDETAAAAPPEAAH